MTLAILSPAFADRTSIPEQYTCDGDDRPPALQWSGAPPRTASFALIVDDPDAPDPTAPTRTFVHWVVYDIPPGTVELAEGAALPEGTRQGPNDAGTPGYSGPCPPIGRHRYFFKLYALDILLGEIRTATKGELERRMHGHVLEGAQLMGTYERRATEAAGG